MYTYLYNYLVQYFIIEGFNWGNRFSVGSESNATLVLRDCCCHLEHKHNTNKYTHQFTRVHTGIQDECVHSQHHLFSCLVFLSHCYQ